MKEEDIRTFEEMKEMLGNKYDKYMYDMNLQLFKQLQSYKDKEERLREYTNNIMTSAINSHFDAPVIKAHILQILNEVKEELNEKF